MLYETEKPPNKYTKAMGDLIRKAREETGLSQEQLAERIYRKRLAVSEMENGKVEISAWTLPLLASALNKPVTYFYPPFVLRQLVSEDLTSLEQELLLHFRNIYDEHLQKLALDQIRVISNFDPTDMILEEYDSIMERKRIEEETKTLINKRRKKGSEGD